MPDEDNNSGGSLGLDFSSLRAGSLNYFAGFAGEENGAEKSPLTFLRPILLAGFAGENNLVSLLAG